MALQVDQLRHMAEHHPEEVAYVDLARGQEWTFREWEETSNRLARGLIDHGVAPGDRVAIFLDGDEVLAWITAYAAIHKAGGVAVPTNTRLSVRELEAVLGHAEPTVVVTSSRLAPTLGRATVPTLRHVIEVDGVDWETWLAHSSTAIQVATRGDDLADIMYTSGTTGLPKGIAVHHDGLHMIRNGTPKWGGQQWFHGSPLFTFAGIAFIYNPMKMGMGALYLPRFDAGTWLDVVEQRRPSMAFLVPAMVQLLLGHERFDSADLSSLTVLSIGSAPLPPTLHRTIADRLPDAAVTNNYSMTEAGTCFTYLPREELERRAGSVGIPMGTEIRIGDAAGEPLPPDEIGEVLIKVGTKHREYYRDPEATAATWSGEWLHSGDLGYLDADGFLYISGRAKDVIIRGGNNVHSADIEAVLYEHPGIAEAAVAAVPHDVLGEDVGAWVVARDDSGLTAEDVTEFCRERLADYKVPRVVTFVDELPRNPTGKVLKQQLTN